MIVSWISPLDGSSRITVLSRWFETQIESNAASTAVGPLPTDCVSVTLTSVGSTRATPFGAYETQTPWEVNATPEGCPANGTDRVSPEVGSMRSSTAPTESATQSAPSPNAIPIGTDPAERIV